MKKYILAVQCVNPNCGQWRKIETDNLDKGRTKCFVCGRTKNLRSSKGWNVNFKVADLNQDLDYMIGLLNYKEGTNK
jgi:hypothetical protein